MLKPPVVLIAITFLAFLGFLDSTYLTILHYQNIIPPCTVKGCEIVLTSKYSTIGSIPVSLLGVLFYVAVMGYSIILLDKNPKSSSVIGLQFSVFRKKLTGSRFPGLRTDKPKTDKQMSDNRQLKTDNRMLFKMYLLLVVMGFIISILFFSIQAFVLKSFCQYCLFSEGISTLILVLALSLKRSIK